MSLYFGLAKILVPGVLLLGAALWLVWAGARKSMLCSFGLHAWEPTKWAITDPYTGVRLFGIDGFACRRCGRRAT